VDGRHFGYKQKFLRQGVCRHTVAFAMYIKKYLIKAKEEFWELKYFTMQKIQSSKKSSKRNPKSFKIYYNLITNLKFQHKPKYHLSKILI
jgi:hypothetical protein